MHLGIEATHWQDLATKVVLHLTFIIAACKLSRWVVFGEFPEECVEGREDLGK